MKLLMLLLAIAVGQQLTWYEFYERGEKHFAREDYRECIADMDRALGSKPEPARNVFTRAVQKIDYKPYYYKAMAHYRLNDLPAAYQFAQRAFRAPVVRELPLLQSDLAKILEEYSAWMEGQHRIFEKEKRSLEVRKAVTTLMLQEKLEEASAILAELNGEESSTFADLRQLVENQMIIRQEEKDLRANIFRSINQAIQNGSWEVARKLVDMSGNKFSEATRRQWTNTIQTGLAFEQANQPQEPAVSDVEVPSDTDQQELEESLKILDDYKQRLSDLEKLASEASEDLAYAERENELLNKQLEAKQSEVPAPPRLILAAHRELGRRVRVEAQVMAPMPIQNRRLLLNGLVIEVPSTDWHEDPDGLVLETEVVVPSYGSHEFVLEAHDITGQRQRQMRQITLTAPFWSSTWFLYLMIAVPIACILALLFGWWSRRRKAHLRNFNPYIAGSPVRERDMFYGRDQLLTRIQGLVHKNCFMIHGERRIGKTSLLLQLKTNLMRDESDRYAFFPVFIDLQGIREEELFHHFMGEIVAQAVDWSISLDEMDYSDRFEHYQNRQFSRDIKRVISRLQATTNKHVVVVLLVDEVDVLNEFGDKTNQKLRGIFMKEYAEFLSCIMAGIHLKKEWESSGSPWYNFFEEIPIDSLEEKAARKLILKPVKGIFKYQPEAVAQIMRSASGHPYLIQKICVSLVDESLRNKRFLITKEDVERYLISLRKETQEKGVS